MTKETSTLSESMGIAGRAQVKKDALVKEHAWTNLSDTQKWQKRRAEYCALRDQYLNGMKECRARTDSFVSKWHLESIIPQIVEVYENLDLKANTVEYAGDPLPKIAEEAPLYKSPFHPGHLDDLTQIINTADDPKQTMPSVKISAEGDYQSVGNHCTKPTLLRSITFSDRGDQTLSIDFGLGLEDHRIQLPYIENEENLTQQIEGIVLKNLIQENDRYTDSVHGVWLDDVDDGKNYCG